jgi:hypothetical protein
LSFFLKKKKKHNTLGKKIEKKYSQGIFLGFITLFIFMLLELMQPQKKKNSEVNIYKKATES